MNLLTEALPESVRVGPLSLPMDTDFRAWIRLEDLLLDETIGQGQKALLALELAYPNGVPPMLSEEALEKVFWFYTCGQVAPEDAVAEDSGPIEPAFSYEQDGAYIYAAFLEQYGIDLTKESLHWWKFRALFQSLNPSTQFVKIMNYRKMKIPADMPASQREFYTKMKKLYALPISAAEAEQQKQIEEVLLNGGDLSAIL